VILDTNGLSALAEGESALERSCARPLKSPFLSLAWVNNRQEEEQLFLSAVTKPVALIVAMPGSEEFQVAT
jgi:hypothetical protein